MFDYPITEKLMDKVGIEPTTSRWLGDCSTDWATGPMALH